MLVLLCACTSIGTGTGGGGDDAPDDDVPPTDEETPPCTNCVVDGLDSTVGCGGVYNPDQLLDYHITMRPSDWTAVKNDSTNSVYYPATFQCGTDAPLPFQIGIRRKRSGGTVKPGIKINFHEYQIGGSHFSLKKFSLENGQSDGTTNASPRWNLMGEYLSWRLMVLSKTISSRAVAARLFVNGTLIGVYVNVEQVDKRFLRSRGKDDEGWLFKQSGSLGDGYKTNETVPNPYHDRLCFWHGQCATPADLATYLPTHLDIEQMLHFGAVNAFVANTDGPIAKGNNYYYYDDPVGSPRLYIPWDLDTTMKQVNSVFTFRSAMFTDVLYTSWEDDYDQLLTTLIAGPLTLATVNAELDRLQAVAGAAFDEDTNFAPTTFTDTLASLKAYWVNRHPQISSEVAAHAP